MFDWDDLRIFLAAARAGSLGRGGQRVGLDTATMGRRIARLESALKSTLLIRSTTGLKLTAAGAQLLQAAVEVEAATDKAGRVIHPDLVAGTVRVSAAEGFGSAVLAPALPGLAGSRPGLRIELAAHAGFLSPSRREVDMAITLSAPEPQRLVVERLAQYHLGLYASNAYLQRRGAPETVEDLRRCEIVGYVDDLIYAAELRYLDELAPGLLPTLSSSSIQAQRAIIVGGGGVGVLPRFIARGLTRVLPHVCIERTFWLSTHEGVHDTLRIRVVRGWLKDLVQRERDRLLYPS